MHDADIDLMIFALKNWNEMFLKYVLSKNLIEKHILCGAKFIDECLDILK
jgi:hypothetical protein